MPRLSDDQIKAGILHDDPDVRLAALRYFTGSYSRDTAVMPLAIQAIERYGRAAAFRHSPALYQLAQTEETLRWVVAQLKAAATEVDLDGDLYALSLILCETDPRLVAPFEGEALAALGTSDPALRERFASQVRRLSRSNEELWRELEAICREGADALGTYEFRFKDAEDVVAALALQGTPDTERMIAALAGPADPDNSVQVWMQSLMAQLAGRLRHEAAVPHLVARLHDDLEVLSEDCDVALTRIGTDAVVRTIREQYPTGEYHFRLYATGALEHVHSDLAVEACIDLLKTEHEPELRDFLAVALAGHFSTEGNEVVLQALRDDPHRGDARDALMASCALTGQVFPELEAWRREAEEEEKKRRQAIYSPRAPLRAPRYEEEEEEDDWPLGPPVTPPAVRLDPKVGRNDPCPCGSGKKFKKCCLKKMEGP